MAHADSWERNSMKKVAVAFLLCFTLYMAIMFAIQPEGRGYYLIGLIVGVIDCLILTIVYLKSR